MDHEEAGGGRPEHEYSLGRILAVSDGVYAFSLTLLVVELIVPSTTAATTLAAQLVSQAPGYLSYLLSFAVVASTWYGHHDNFKYIRQVDGRLIALNFANLLLVAFLPFPTAVLGRNIADPVAAIFYAATLVLMNLASMAMWWYATQNRRLVAPNLDRRILRVRFYRPGIGAAVFLVSIPAALWRPVVAEVMWIPLFAMALVVRPRGASR